MPSGWMPKISSTLPFFFAFVFFRRGTSRLDESCEEPWLDSLTFPRARDSNRSLIDLDAMSAILGPSVMLDGSVRNEGDRSAIATLPDGSVAIARWF